MLLTEGVRADTPESIFANISFIIFNYDRCIEHFLFYSLQNYYGIDKNTAADLIQQIRITHPYGVVGKLPWQEGGGDQVPFGAGAHPNTMVRMAGQIKTFTERVEDDAARDAMRAQLQGADTVVFLGFAFHPMNLQLITPERTSLARRAFATGYGISSSDINVIHNDIVQMLRQGSKKPGIEINIRQSLTCASLFSEYWHTLSRT